MRRSRRPSSDAVFPLIVEEAIVDITAVGVEATTAGLRLVPRDDRALDRQRAWSPSDSPRRHQTPPPSLGATFPVITIDRTVRSPP